MNEEDPSPQRLEQVEARLRKLLASQPTVAETHAALGNILSRLGRLDEATACFRTAISLDASRAETHNDFGVLLVKQGKVDEAQASYEKALLCRSDFPLACNNIGLLLMTTGRHTEAKIWFSRALSLAPAYAEAHTNLGECHYHDGDFAAALHCFRRALDHKPDLGTARLSKSLIDLLLGNFADGWRDYCPQNAQHRLGIRFSTFAGTLPRHLAGTQILLVKNQGIGDEIFFSRFAPQLRARGAQVNYLTEPRSAEMFRRCGAFDDVLEPGLPLPQADSTFLIEQLPQLLGMDDPTQIPASIRIPVLGRAQEAIRNRLRLVGTPPFIGVTWRAGIGHDSSIRMNSRDNLLHKEVPLQDMARSLHGSSGEIIILQRGARPGELETFASAAERRVHDFSDVSDNLEDILAIVSLLDEYVTVSNTNVHLRTAVGKSSRVLIPFPPEWRWMRDSVESPWFPECRTYRQEPNGDWSAAFARLRRDMEGR